VIATAQGLVPDLEHEVGEILGADRVRRLRADLEAIRRTIPSRDSAASAEQVRQ
jgi:hypothetical protein